MALQVGGWQTILAYVREGFGVGLLPSSVADASPAALTVKELPPRLVPPNRVRLICRPREESGTGRDLSEHAESFWRGLLAAAKRPSP